MATRGKESRKCSMISGIYICKLDGSVVKLLSESSWINKQVRKYMQETWEGGVQTSLKNEQFKV